MGFFMFHRPEMPRFKYIPRFYDPDKEELEKKKAAMGYYSKLSDKEKLRMRLRSRWNNTSEDEQAKKNKRLRFIVIFTLAAFLTYFIVFTPFVENFVIMFLKMGGK